jgi:hypothetical protein
MGMFDYVRCVYPLPVDGANDKMYQTKSLDYPSLDMYEIRADGTLWRQRYEDQNWEPIANTGEIRFYDWLEPDGWLEWSAYFKHGTLLDLNLIEHRPRFAEHRREP